MDLLFFFSSRRRHTRLQGDWSSDVCSSDLVVSAALTPATRLVTSLEYQKNTSPGMGAGFPLFYADGSRTDFDRSVSNNARWSHFGTENTTATLDLTHRLDNRWLLRAAYSRNDGNYDMRYVYRGGAPDASTGLGMANSFIKYRGDRSRDSLHLTASGPVALFGRQHEIAVGWNHVRDDIDIRRYAPLGTPPATDNFLDWRNGSLARSEEHTSELQSPCNLVCRLLL